MRGLEIVCGGSLYLTSLVHFFFFATYVSFFSTSYWCISFKKILPPTLQHDEIASSHAIPWKQERLSNNWLHPQWSPSFNSHLLVLFIVFDFRSQKSACVWGVLLHKAYVPFESPVSPVSSPVLIMSLINPRVPFTLIYFRFSKKHNFPHHRALHTPFPPCAVLLHS